MKNSNASRETMFRQAGLRFFWTGGHSLFAETPNGDPVAFIYAGDPVKAEVTISEVEAAIDKFCEQRKTQP